MTMTRLVLGAAASAIFTAASAGAQPAPPPPPGVAQGTAPAAPAPQVRRFVHRMPMKTETRDGVVAHVREKFAKLDGNKDGYVTREEAQAHHRAMTDKVRDVTKRFAIKKPDRGAMFDKLDTNKDGSISRQEYLSAKPQTHERRVFVMRDGDGPVEAGGEPGQPGVKVMRLHRSGFGMRMHVRMFERADANRDGRVSLQEMTDGALRHFDQADSNRDGQLTPDERVRVREKRNARRMQPA